MKTRDRILHTSLELFNVCGEPAVTTIDIANELDISPGNLYYHFRNKDDIISALYELFEAEAHETLTDSVEPGLEMMDYWLFVQLVLETGWHYRFLYRDSATILARNPGIHRRFNRVLARHEALYRELITTLIEADAPLHDTRLIDLTATNMLLVSCNWVNFNQIRDQAQSSAEAILSQGVMQLLIQLSPFIGPESRDMLFDIAESYLGDALSEARS